MTDCFILLYFLLLTIQISHNIIFFLNLFNLNDSCGNKLQYILKNRKILPFKSQSSYINLIFINLNNYLKKLQKHIQNRIYNVSQKVLRQK